jgi:hypothetical protein
MIRSTTETASPLDQVNTEIPLELARHKKADPLAVSSLPTTSQMFLPG